MLDVRCGRRRLLHARRHLLCYGGHILRIIVQPAQHLLELFHHGVCLLGFLMHLLHKALHLAECLDDCADLILPLGERGRNFTREIPRCYGTQMTDGRSKRIGDIIRNAP